MSTDTPVQPGSVQRSDDHKPFPKLKSASVRTPEERATDQLWVHLTTKPNQQEHCAAPDFNPGSVIRFVVRDRAAAGRPWRIYAAIYGHSYWTIGGTGNLHQLPMQTTENLLSILRQQDFGDAVVGHNLAILSLGDKEWQL
jgi:hypothetical protein